MRTRGQLKIAKALSRRQAANDQRRVTARVADVGFAPAAVNVTRTVMRWLRRDRSARRPALVTSTRTVTLPARVAVAEPLAIVRRRSAAVALSRPAPGTATVTGMPRRSAAARETAATETESPGA
jgi:hypothetical protein